LPPYRVDLIFVITSEARDLLFGGTNPLSAYEHPIPRLDSFVPTRAAEYAKILSGKAVMTGPLGHQHAIKTAD
jgi:hypothetical protein